jgi:oxygen-dependent protoporphyrinogen oxidase
MSFHKQLDLTDGVPDLCGRKVIVVGAGVAGLTCAHHLKKRGVDAEVLERSRFAGGLSRSALYDDRYIVDFGPSAYQASSEILASLARELSIDKLVVGDADLRHRLGILRRGKVVAIPTSKVELMLSPIVSFGSKTRIISRHLAMDGMTGSESLSEFVRLRLGDDVLENIVAPMTAWIAGADSEALEAASSIGWLVEGIGPNRVLGAVRNTSGLKSLKPGVHSFRWGMGTITARLEELLKGQVRCGCECSSMDMKEDGGFIIGIDDNHKLLSADAVIVATPAAEASQLTRGISQRLATPLAEIPYSPMVVVNLAFSSDDIPSDTKASTVLVPRGESTRILGFTFTSRIFPGRCPAGQEMLTVLLGGACDEAAYDLTDEKAVEEALDGLRHTIGVSAQPKFRNVRRIERAQPQYTIGHKRRLTEIREAMLECPGLFLTGNYFSGISLTDTIAHARGSADRAVEYLRVRFNPARPRRL